MPATRAAKIAALVVLVATPVVAQPPGNRPVQPGAQQPAGLPLPPGYRPRTPPPQAQPQRPPTAPVASGAVPGTAGSGGRIMYFQKPADSTTATGTDTGAERAVPAPIAVVPAIPAPAYQPLPPPPSRYLPPDPAPAATPIAYQPPEQPKAARPDEIPSVSKKQDMKIVPVDPQFVQLPPRENIFMVYNDLELEKAIMERVRQDLKSQVDPMTGKGRYTPDQERYLVFPALPVLSPPDVPYRPKTLAYEPRKVILEQGYVVHRRLHFEEKNGERAGWDLGPLSTLVGAGYFYRDVILWPQSLVSGCVSGFWSTSAGKCIPGSPSPYYLYPVGLTITGTATETAVITGAAFLFP